MKFKILKSSSKGNAYLLNDELLFDCGIAFKHLEDVIDNIKLILLTHEHSDHINVSTLKKLINTHNTKCVAPMYLKEKLDGINGINLVSTDTIIETKKYVIKIFDTFHDVPNVAYFVHNKETKVNHFHATDTFQIPVVSEEIDSISIETNYCEDEIQKLIEQDINDNKYCHYIRSQKNHLSVQKALKFIEDKNVYKFWSLHKSEKMEETINKKIKEFENDRR